MVASLKELSNAELAKVFCAVTGQTVSRFASIQLGRKRVGKALAESGTDLRDAMSMAGMAKPKPVVNASVSNVPAPDPEKPEVLETFDRRRRMSVADAALSSKPREEAPQSAPEPLTGPPPAVKPGSRLETVLALLWRDDGATVAEVCEATGWLPHTARAYLSKGGAAGRAATIMTERVERDGRKTTVYSVR